MSFIDGIEIQKKLWGLRDNPFPNIPPRDCEKVAKFFVGRDNEIDRALSTLYYGDNVFIKGAWGIGKTAFILYSLYKLSQEAKEHKNIIPIYISHFRGGSAEEFYQVIFCAMQNAIRKRFGNNILDRIKPDEIGANIYILQAKWQKTVQQIAPITENIEQCLKILENKGCLPVIAVDDLDKSTMQQAGINSMLKDSLHLLRDQRCSFLITSRSVARFDDLEDSQLGIADMTIALGHLNRTEIRKAIINQLNVMRSQFREDAYPFTDTVVSRIAEKSLGIPRVFNTICKKTLSIASIKGYKVIDDDQFAICFNEIQNDLSVEIPKDIKTILYYALEKGGFCVSSKEQSFEREIKELGYKSVHDFLPYLDDLVRRDYMVKIGNSGEIIYQNAPGTEKAAKEGQQISDFR